MILDNIFNQIKENGYVEDKTYNVGDISEATGLQKQPDGSWKPPKKTGKSQAGKDPVHAAEHKQLAISKMTPENRAAVESGKTYRYADKNGVSDITKEDLAEGAGSVTIPESKKRDFVEFGNVVENSIPMTRLDQSELHKLKQYMADDGTDYKEALRARATRLADQARETGSKAFENEQSIMNIANAVGYGNDLHSFIEEELHYDFAGARGQAEKIHAGVMKAMSSQGQPKTSKGYIESMSKEEALSAAKKAGNTAFLMKNEAGRYTVVNNAIEFDKAQKVGYEAANEEISEPKTRIQEAVSSNRMKKDLDGNFWSRPDDFKEDITSRGWDVEEMNNEYAVISNEKGSQYEVRFDDHRDGGDLTVRTFKPLMVDEDDDDELTDAAPKRVLTGDTMIRVRAATTEDKRYNVGDISEATGKQKQPDGSWKYPKNGMKGHKAGDKIDNERDFPVNSKVEKSNPQHLYTFKKGGRVVGIKANSEGEAIAALREKGVKVKSSDSVGNGKRTQTPAPSINLNGKTGMEKVKIIYDAVKEKKPKYAVKRYKDAYGEQREIVCELKLTTVKGQECYIDKTGNSLGLYKTEELKTNKNGNIELNYKTDSGRPMTVEFTSTPPANAVHSKAVIPGAVSVPSSEALLTHLV